MSRLKHVDGRILNIMQMIEETMRDYPETRNSDTELQKQIWRTFYKHLVRTGATGKEGVWLEDIDKLPRGDSVTRLRAKIQNELGKYPPTTWEVAKGRGIEESRWRYAMNMI